MRSPLPPLLAMHAILTLVAATGFVVLNVVTSSGSFWAIWVIWPLATALAVHAGAWRLRGAPLLGAWLGGGLLILLGLIAIDAMEPSRAWWYWPAGVWMVLSALFIGLRMDVLSLAGVKREED